MLEEGGRRAAKVSTRVLPDMAVRLAATVDASLRSITLTLVRRHAFSSAKAQRVLGWRPRPGAQTVVDCAESLLAHGVI
jgi:dihydroflavonol-4-reductase